MEDSPQAPLPLVAGELRTLAWTLVLSGAISILIGVLAFAAPLPTLAALVLLFGVYAIADGVIAFVALVRAMRRGTRMWPHAVRGVAGILVGLFTFLSPPVTGVMLLVVLAAWAVVVGVLELVTAVRLSSATRRAWLFALYGVVSIAFGAFLVLSPAGVFAVAALVGMYAFVRGVTATWVGFAIRRAVART